MWSHAKNTYHITVTDKRLEHREGRSAASVKCPWRDWLSGFRHVPTNRKMIEVTKHQPRLSADWLARSGIKPRNPQRAQRLKSSLRPHFLNQPNHTWPTHVGYPSPSFGLRAGPWLTPHLLHELLNNVRSCTSRKSMAYVRSVGDATPPGSGVRLASTRDDEPFGSEILERQITIYLFDSVFCPVFVLSGLQTFLTLSRSLNVSLLPIVRMLYLVLYTSYAQL